MLLAIQNFRASITLLISKCRSLVLSHFYVYSKECNNALSRTQEHNQSVNLSSGRSYRVISMFNQYINVIVYQETRATVTVLISEQITRRLSLHYLLNIQCYDISSSVQGQNHSVDLSADNLSSVILFLYTIKHVPLSTVSVKYSL